MSGCNFCVIAPSLILAESVDGLSSLWTCGTLNTMQLTPSQIRVLGALIEKEITTPDIYPLSLNALQAASNQRSSRDPVLDLAEEDLRQALHGLEDLGLASAARGSLSSPAGRVAKYEHHARTVLSLRRDETALLCLLLLRGAQTPGELRSRADRLHSFDDLGSVIATLDRLSARSIASEGAASTGPLVAVLPRQPGSREARYIHLLGDPDALSNASVTRHSTGSALPEIGELAATVAALEARLSLLEQRLSLLEGTPAD